MRQLAGVAFINTTCYRSTSECMSLLAGPSSHHNHIISAIISWIVCSIANHPYLQINGYSPLVTGINHDFIVTCLHWVIWLLEKTGWAEHVSKCISSTILSIMPIHTYVLLFDACNASIVIACDGLNRNVLSQCLSRTLYFIAFNFLLWTSRDCGILHMMWTDSRD